MHLISAWRAGGTPGAARWWWLGLSRRTAVACSALVAAVSCLTGLSSQPLSWDEAVTANAASRSVPELWLLIRHTDAPLASYYLAMHGWQGLLASAGLAPGAGWLRLPSALAAIVAVALTALLAADLFGPRVGLLAGVLIAVHPLLVFYAHDARPYTLVTAAVLASTAALRRALRAPTVGRLAVYCASCVLIVYAHLFAVLALLAHAVIVARYGQRRGRFVAVAVVVAATGAPLVWLAAHQVGEIGWVPRPDPATVGSFLFRICGASALAALALAGAVVVWRRLRAGAGRGPGAATGSAALVGWWAVLPPVALIAASFVQPVLVARYALVAVPALIIVVALLLSRVGGRAAAGLAAVAVLIGAAVLVYQQSRPYKYEDFRAAADTVTDSARPGDGLVFLPSSLRVGYDEYRRPDATDPAVPVAVDLGLLSPATWRRDGVIGGQECSPAVLGQRIGSHPRIFLVGATLDAALRDRHSATERAKEQALGSGYRVVWTAHDGDVAVTLLERSPSGGPAPSG